MVLSCRAYECRGQKSYFDGEKMSDGVFCSMASGPGGRGDEKRLQNDFERMPVVAFSQ